MESHLSLLSLALFLQKISYARQIESPLSLLSLALFLAENKLRSASKGLFTLCFVKLIGWKILR